MGRMRELDSHVQGAGKGDLPRSCWSDDFRTNYDAINWTKKDLAANRSRKGKKTKKQY